MPDNNEVQLPNASGSISFGEGASTVRATVSEQGVYERELGRTRDMLTRRGLLEIDAMAGSSLENITYHNYTSKDNECVACGDKIGEVKDYRLCDECKAERLIICDVCGKQSIHTYRQSRFEDKDGIGRVLLCEECCKDIRRCLACNISFKVNHLPPCEECGLELCSLHINDHECGERHSGYLPNRKYARESLAGNVDKATIVKHSREVGVEIEAVGGEYEDIAELPSGDGITHDGSLKGTNPVEIQTQPASADKLERLVRNTTKSLRAAGYKVNKSCGIHIHVDSPDIYGSGINIIKLIRTYYAIEPLIFSMLPESRRHNMYAMPLSKWLSAVKVYQLANYKDITSDVIEEAWYKSHDRNAISRNKNARYDSSRYFGFNLHSLFANGHIELRYHHGSLNPVKILNWINFHLTVIDWVVKNFDGDKVDAIYAQDNVYAKLRLMTKFMKFNRTTRRYVLKALRKFENLPSDIE